MDTRKDAVEGPSNDSRESASILGAAGGTIQIQGGQFNATAGHHISVTINAGNEPPTSATAGIQTDLQASIFVAQRGDKRPADNGMIELDSFERSYNPASSSSSRPQNRTPSPALQRSCDIYYRHIGAKGRGSPLWIPGPNKNLHIDYQREGISIGDVGIITADGRFDFLFNICLPPDHPINPPVLPEDFIPLYLPMHDIQQYSEFSEQSYLSSSSVKKSHLERHVHIRFSSELSIMIITFGSDTPGLIFESSASEGAILAMPMGLNSAQLANVRLFRKYAAKHAENWYRYANDARGREAGNGDVRLVIGYDKTTKWGMATFSNSSAGSEGSLLLKFRPLEPEIAGSEKTYGWEYSGMAEVRAGPDRREIQDLGAGDQSEETSAYENQCLFVRTLNVTLQEKIWKKLALELGDVDIDDVTTTDLTDSLLFPSFKSASKTSSSATNSSTSGRQIDSHFVTGQGIKVDEKRPISTPSSGVATTWHPSNGINKLILDANPAAQVVVTEDSDWISVLCEDDYILPPPRLLYARMLKLLVVKSDEGMIYLENNGFDIGVKGPSKLISHPSPKKRHHACQACSTRKIRCSLLESPFLVGIGEIPPVCSSCKRLGLSCTIGSTSKVRKYFHACNFCRVKKIRCNLEGLAIQSLPKGVHPTCQSCQRRDLECAGADTETFLATKRKGEHPEAPNIRARHEKSRSEQSTSSFPISDSSSSSEPNVSKAPWPPFTESQLPALADAFAGFEEYIKDKAPATFKTPFEPASGLQSLYKASRNGDFQTQDPESDLDEPGLSNQSMAMDLSPDFPRK